LEKAKPAAQKEFAQLTAFAKELDGIDQLEKWDGAYYSEKLKQKLFSLDDELLKPYFKLENVLNGAFTIAKNYSELLLKKFLILTNTTKMCKLLKYWILKEISCYFLLRFFPRKGKRNGAWMTSYKSIALKTINERPHVSIVCNFTPPTETEKPSLLTFNEVTTLFHEFGHALHGMLPTQLIQVYRELRFIGILWNYQVK
jgi:Zn-dependent oligopeptidase